MSVQLSDYQLNYVPHGEYLVGVKIVDLQGFEDKTHKDKLLRSISQKMLQGFLPPFLEQFKNDELLQVKVYLARDKKYDRMRGFGRNARYALVIEIPAQKTTIKKVQRDLSETIDKMLSLLPEGGETLI